MGRMTPAGRLGRRWGSRGYGRRQGLGEVARPRKTIRAWLRRMIYKRGLCACRIALYQCFRRRFRMAARLILYHMPPRSLISSGVSAL